MPNYREDRPGTGLPSEQSSLFQGTHEELVAAFRATLKAEEENNRILGISPEESIRERLFARWGHTPMDSERRRFFEPIQDAWEVLIYNRLEPGSYAEQNGAGYLEGAYKRHPIITLNPGQIAVIDAIAEAVGIPHRRGQSEIPIPEKFADRSRWRASAEYRQRLARANAKKMK